MHHANPSTRQAIRYLDPKGFRIFDLWALVSRPKGFRKIVLISRQKSWTRHYRLRSNSLANHDVEVDGEALRTPETGVI